MKSFLLLSTFTLATLSAASGSSDASYQNVYGQTLQSCSSDGMALTGYTRNGYCVDQNDDSGSHHICIDMTSTTGGDFCGVTGQSDWCSSEMPCHDDQSENCQVQHWCVCQWAFASYIANAGGCDSIQDVVCDAINIQALIAYQQQAGGSEKYQNALNCVLQKCGIEQDDSSYFSGLSMANRNGNKLQVTGRPMNFLVVAFALAVLGVVGAFVVHQRRSSRHVDSNKEGLITDHPTSYKAC
ncbi:unnamed protein product [Cylindrotheca closterium]|uniref:Lysozyme n=1 Tax=Cylindrotheca closterium TaxID=2856 RepID=A0AAD2G1I2_9STRA|nr:unnamed protein product [Cylindrotheca closterium]